MGITADILAVQSIYIYVLSILDLVAFSGDGESRRTACTDLCYLTMFADHGFTCKMEHFV